MVEMNGYDGKCMELEVATFLQAIANTPFHSAVENVFLKCLSSAK